MAPKEIDGEFGMLGFVKTPEFRALNVGLSLDEGIASADDEVPLYYGERNCFWLKITCPGSPGHGSRFVENPAGEKAHKVINKLLAYRAEEKARLEANPDLTLGDVTTVNLTLYVHTSNITLQVLHCSLLVTLLYLCQDGGRGPGQRGAGQVHPQL